MIQPGRKYSATDSYRYGFNGKENDNEIKGEGNQQDYGMRIYDPRLGRFLSVDPLFKSFPWNTTYSYSESDPINFVDLDGLEKAPPPTRSATTTIQKGTSAQVVNAITTKKSMCHIPNNDVLKYPGYSNDETFEQWVQKGQLRNLSYHFLKGAWETIRYFGAASKREYGGSEASDDYGQMGEQMRKGIEDFIDKIGHGTPEEKAEALGGLAVGAVIGGGKGKIRVVEEHGYAVVRDINGKFVADAYLSVDGELNLSIITRETELKGRGSDVFRSLHDYINTNWEKINSIRGTWRTGQLSSNLDQFNKYLKEGLSAEEAALKTFTGTNAKNLGFKNVKILETLKDSKGNVTSVDVLFTK